MSAGKLDGLRLDVRRLAASMSIVSAKHTLEGNKVLAQMLSAIHFHSSIVDRIDAVVMRFAALDDLFW